MALVIRACPHRIYVTDVVMLFFKLASDIMKRVLGSSLEAL